MSDAYGNEQESLAQRFRENATSIVSTLVTAIWMGALFTNQDWWLAALLVGYVAVVPITAMLFGDEEDQEEWLDRDNAERRESDETNDDDEETPLETLRRRYAEGELTEAQFERKLDRLLSTETIEDAEDERERTAERER